MKETYLTKKDAKLLLKWFRRRFEAAQAEARNATDIHKAHNKVTELMIAKDLVFSALGWVTPDFDNDIKELIPYEDYMLERLTRKIARDS